MCENPFNFQEISWGRNDKYGVVYIRRIPPDDKLDFMADRKLNIIKEEGF